MSEARRECEDLTDHRRGLRSAGGIVLLLLIAAFIVAGAAARVFGPAPSEGREGALPIDPLRRLRAGAEAEWSARAHAWQWLDPGPQVAQIPVERAADLMLERGFPIRRRPAGPVTARTWP